MADLERARAWWETTTPLRMVAETSADQAFPSLGIARGRFEGYMLHPELPPMRDVAFTTPDPEGCSSSSSAPPRRDGGG